MKIYFLMSKQVLMESSAFGLRSKVPRIEHHNVPFYDVVGMLQNPLVLRQVIDWFVTTIRRHYPTVGYLVLPDSRGYIFAEVGTRLGLTVVFAPKNGKLPDDLVDKISYGTEYSQDTICMRKNSITPGSNVIIIDDVIATGGSFIALKKLVEKQGGRVYGGLFMADAGVVENLSSVIQCQYHAYIYFSGPMSKIIRYQPAPNEVKIPTDNVSVILSSPALEYLARQVDGYYLPIQWGRFPDGTHNIKFPSCLKKRKVRYFMSLQPEFIWQEMLVMEVLARQGLDSLHIYIPYLPSGTMERVSEPGVLATAEVELRKLSEQPITRKGPARIHFLDAHAPVSLFYLRDGVHVEHHSAIPLLKRRIRCQNIVIVFPDDGSYKRFSPFFQGYPMIVCTKLRDPVNPLSRKVTVNETYGMNSNFDWKNSNVEFLIVDDLAHSGGTLLECAKMLTSFGAQKISAYVTHMVGENNSFEKLLNGPFKTIYFTDSTPTSIRAHHFNEGHYQGNGKTCLLSSIDAMGLETNKRCFEGYLLASTSRVKALGVYQALVTKSNNFELFLTETDSGIAPQPISLEKTTEGALNRGIELNKIWNKWDRFFNYHENNNSTCLAIESGLILQPNHQEVTVLSSSSDPTVHIDTRIIPGGVVDSYLTDLGVQDSTTLGSYLASTGGFSSDNWHQRVLGISRSDIITDLVRKSMLAQVPDSQVCDLEREHE